MTEPDRTPDLRISDAERHAVAEILRDAAGSGRIDLEELDERLEATYAARTYADLVPLTSDLPSAPTPARAQPEAAPATTGGVEGEARPVRHLAIMSGLERKGVWTVPAAMTITCIMGGADLDLREARWTTGECVLTVNAFMGGASIVVGPDVDVVVEGTGIMGGYSAPSGLVDSELADDAPVLRVRGIAVWGGVSVERKHRKGRGGLPDGRKPHRLH
ncbi:DUF1707 domain-containing protein [Nocardioides sp.]|uniref:DUF1707 SHOCT-like domain-containing protein n=1 Tax=Nocardioides sp. TaxID=35761 RepID=UPI002717646D|nr:DUF1707 domain-containing protein [Nocardioides sp.]MDO9456952.1 DUF1707 domain-containing protein [Nocardioides sp.]